MTPLTTAPGLGRVRQWLSAHPLAADALLAAFVLAAALLGTAVGPHSRRFPLGLVFVLFTTLACGALVLRRRAPRTVLAATVLLAVAEIVATRHDETYGQVTAAVVIALYTVASGMGRTVAWRIAALAVGVLTATVMAFGARPWYAQENFGVFAWTALAGAAGDAVRSRRAFVAEIQERAVRAERTRDEEARRRVAEERLRIARELHDVVAHHIALVNVQAGVASHVMDSRPDQAKQALAHVREASRSALDELRATVGLLRQHGETAAPTEPAPGLAVLDQLVDGFARVGLRVRVAAAAAEPVAAGRPRAGDTAAEVAAVVGPLPVAVDLTAYRVLQEALTNVHKHAGPAATAEVGILRGRASLLLTVRDNGDGPPPDRTDGTGPRPDTGAGPGGHGLIGMRERAVALGGTCEAGPGPDGGPGFAVRVELPLQARTGGDA
ncbi:sensor histidine kinase [Streptomyces varsoviensis]|nr:histidine kinase [Streptomyces varsoviensis]